jgi:hypothetical protein
MHFLPYLSYLADSELRLVFYFFLGGAVLIFTPPWLCYVATVMLGMEKLGVFKSLGLGILLYVFLSAALSHLLLGTKM